ncbi:DUF397 domain-containing protein [Streptomyces sp. NPDC051940]|uniref:DUF397 domain-containing protein n=1 Tax=Streptomyces sp. NPDC051940 TaxID=3155675 RepID=UPI003445BCF2
MSALPRFVPSSQELHDADWIRSSHSTGANNCVEVTPVGAGGLAVRDSKNPQGPALVFTPAAWADFLSAIRGGDI